ncbi:hypothetical protein VTO73DRAFT_9214 [Trametes versicolor]
MLAAGLLTIALTFLAPLSALCAPTAASRGLEVRVEHDPIPHRPGQPLLDRSNTGPHPIPDPPLRIL